MSSNTWRQHFSNLASNEEGDRNMAAFGLALAAGNNTQAKINSLTEDIDTVLIIADDEGCIQALHGPRNFGGTRTRKTNKVGCLVGLGSQATPVLLSEISATADCNIATSTIDDISNSQGPTPSSQLLGFAISLWNRTRPNR